ncbi:DUF2914 domain-containing protein [Thermodesulfobacteriota bacterium]
MDDPGFTINRMVTGKSIAEREPVSISGTFSSDTEKVFCFLEAGDIEVDTTVSFVWYYEGQKMAVVALPLYQGKRWRTYSSKIVRNLKGSWKVELQENSGIVLNTVTFQIQ